MADTRLSACSSVISATVVCGWGVSALGTMSWGRDTDEHEAREQLTAFVSAGGMLVDTAAAYGEGASEETLGALIGDPFKGSRRVTNW